MVRGFETRMEKRAAQSKPGFDGLFRIVADNQSNSRHSPFHKACQKLPPRNAERFRVPMNLVFGQSHRNAQNLPLAIACHAPRNQYGSTLDDAP